jgi:hypothetical protein
MRPSVRVPMSASARHNKTERCHPPPRRKCRGMDRGGLGLRLAAFSRGGHWNAPRWMTLLLRWRPIPLPCPILTAKPASVATVANPPARIHFPRGGCLRAGRATLPSLPIHRWPPRRPECPPGTPNRRHLPGHAGCHQLFPEIRTWPADARRCFRRGRPRVLLAAKTYGSVFYDKLTPSIGERKWRFDSLHPLALL